MGHEDVGPPTGQAAQKQAAGGGGACPGSHSNLCLQRSLPTFEKVLALPTGLHHEPQKQLLAGVRGKHLSPGAAGGGALGTDASQLLWTQLGHITASVLI